MAGAVSIVIPNYNGRDLMERHLPGVRRALEVYPGGGELIVVDDASRDGSAEWIAGAHPDARLVVHPENRGFQAACTAGLRAARSEKVVLLNTDADVFEDFLSPLAETLDQEDVFAAGSVALSEEDLRVGENLKLPYLHCGRLRFRKLPPMTIEDLRSLAPAPLPTLFATGGFMAMKRALFFDLGGFDPLFEPFYYEDADLCWRAWKRGLTVLLDPRSAVVHRHRGSILTHHGERKVRRIQERNRLLLLWKNYTAPGPFLRRHAMPLALRALLKWACLDWDFYAALSGALRRVGRAFAARRTEQREANRTDAEVFEEIRRGWNPHWG